VKPDRLLDSFVRDTGLLLLRVLAGLSRRGVTFERFPFLEQNELGIWTRPDQTKAAWFKDPDGNLFSLAETVAP